MAGNNGPALERTQCVLMRKLAMITEQEGLTQEARDAYARLFEHPLSRSHIAVVAGLFG